MSDYLSLEEAASKLGISADRLVDLRSQGQIRGFRDGTSWKFPESEIERLAEELADSGFGAGILDDSGLSLESDIALTESSGSIIGGDATPVVGDTGSDLDIGNEVLTPGSGSDVNLIANAGAGSDVLLVADSDVSSSSGDIPSGLDVGELLEIDSAELKLDDQALMHDSAMIELAIEPKEGSTGPIAKKAASSSKPASNVESDLSLSASMLEDDSDDLVLGDDDSSGMNVLGSDLDLSSENAVGGKASSLELLDELNFPSGMGSESGSLMSSGGDVLSELDLLGAEQGGSGLISGDSASLLASSGIADLVGDSNDDALADVDDLVIADDDDDLVIDSHGSDISIAGDSGINLMSPSDSGLSLESEPLDLAGSSISALDLGAELAEEGSGIGSGGVGSGADFADDEEFQLSPSGIGLEADLDSGSQVIEVEDSEAIGEAVEFDDADFGGGGFGGGGEIFAAEPAGAAGGAMVAFDDSESDSDSGMAVAGSGAVPAMGSAYEVPFTTLQCVSLAMIMGVMALGGMLMTDLIRNMWTYTEPSAPVSSLTGYLIDLMGW